MHYLAIIAGLAVITAASPVLQRKEEVAANAANVGDTGHGGKLVFLSKEVRQAYINQDGAAIARYNFHARQDYERLSRTMADSQLPSFNSVTLNGTVINYYGDESSYVWTKVLHAQGPEPEKRDVNTDLEDIDPNQVVQNATIEIGQFSASGGQASSWTVEIPRIAADAALGMAVGVAVQSAISRWVSKMVKAEDQAVSRLLTARKNLENAEQELIDSWTRPRFIGDSDSILGDSFLRRPSDLTELNEAVDQASAEVTAANENIFYETSLKTSRITRSLARSPKYIRGVGGVVAVLASTLLLEFGVLPYVDKDYWVKVSILNLDDRTWTVDAWHGSNAIISGGENFTAAILPPPARRSVPFHPDQLSDFKAATEVTYTFQNSNTWFAGLGVALQVSAQDPRTGFMVGYDCPYGKNNSLAIAGGIPTSPKDWYKDDANWPTSKALNVSDTLLVGGTRTKLSAFTDALSGNKDQIYNIWATVGSIESLRDA